MNIYKRLLYLLVSSLFCMATAPFAAATTQLDPSPKIVVVEFHGLKKNIINDNLNDLPEL